MKSYLNSSTAKLTAYVYHVVRGLILTTYFSDGALLVYNSMVKANPSYADSYTKLTKALREKFSSKGGSGRAADLFSRTKNKNESVGRFFMSVSSLAAQAFPTLDDQARDEIIKSQFIRGVDPHTKRQLLNREPKTAHDAFEQAQRMESTEVIMNNESNSNPTPTSSRRAEANAVTEEERHDLVDNLTQSVQVINLRGRNRQNQSDSSFRRNQAPNQRQFDRFGNPTRNCDQYRNFWPRYNPYPPQYGSQQSNYTQNRLNNQNGYQSRRSHDFRSRPNFQSNYQSRPSFRPQEPRNNNYRSPNFEPLGPRN